MVEGSAIAGQAPPFNQRSAAPKYRWKRVVVMSDSKPECIVSIGDLASRNMDGDVEDDISRAEPNN
jgi:hypothetical protein